MKCKYCGVEVANDAQFCPNCGKDLSKLRKCVKCGEIIDDDATFCPHCGAENPIYDEGSHNHKWVWVLVAIVVLAAIGGGIWYFTSHSGGVSSQSAPSTDSMTTDSSASQTKEAGQQLSYDDKQDAKYIEERVAKIYEKVKEVMQSSGETFHTSGQEEINDEFLTAEYSTLFKRVMAAEADGNLILDLDHWTMSQEFDPIDYKVLSANVEEDGVAMASVKYIFSEEEPLTVRLVMKFENGDWYIDDFQCSKAGLNSEKQDCYNSGV